MPRKLPINQVHGKTCTRPSDCDCPWRPRVRDSNGKFHGHRWPTYPEAKQEYHELMGRRPQPLADTTTIAQWAERWQACARTPQGTAWRPATRVNRRGSLTHILPFLGHHKVTELTPDLVFLWVADRQAAGVGAAALYGAAETLRSLYVAWHAAGRPLPYGNPVRVRLPKGPPRDRIPPPTPAQVEAWAQEVWPEVRVIVDLEVLYGGRTSEMLALREEDILFTGRDVGAPLRPQLERLAELPPDEYAARKARLRFQRKLEKDRTPGPIKNKRGNRTLPLPQWAARALSEQFRQWPPVGGWLFVNHRGGRGALIEPAAMPLHVTTYWKILKRAADKAGIVRPPYKCSHWLRYFRASQLNDMGMGATAIGDWIGDHPRTVQNIYIQPMEGSTERTADMLTELRESQGSGTRRLRAV
jgi:integrase